MRPPIIVVSDDVDVFDSVEAAERYLEPWQLDGLRVYDRNGQRTIAKTAKGFMAEIVTLRRGCRTQGCPR